MSDFYPAIHKAADRQWFAQVREYDVSEPVVQAGPFRTQREAFVASGELVAEVRASAEDA